MKVLKLEKTIVADGVVEVLPQSVDGMPNVATKHYQLVVVLSF